MRYVDDERMWQVLAVGTAALAGIAARQALQQGWRITRGEDPPKNPAARSVGWGDALLWTVGTGVVVGLSRLLAERGAAAGWRKVRGHYPRGLD